MSEKEKQVFWSDVVAAAIDSPTTQKFARLVLICLARRCDPSLEFTCYPSIAQLMHDAQVKYRRCLDAIHDLEEKGLIRHWKDGKTDRFVVNYERLLQEANDAKLAKVKRLRENNRATGKKMKASMIAEVADSEPEDQDFPPDPDLDNTDGLDYGDDDPKVIRRKIYQTRNVDEIVLFCKFLWPEHSAFTEEGGIDFLRKYMAECVELAGSAPRVGEVLRMVDEEYGTAFFGTRDSAKLGAYVKKCFPDWLERYPTELESNNEDAQ